MYHYWKEIESTASDDSENRNKNIKVSIKITKQKAPHPWINVLLCYHRNHNWYPRILRLSNTYKLVTATYSSNKKRDLTPQEEHGNSSTKINMLITMN